MPVRKKNKESVFNIFYLPCELTLENSKSLGTRVTAQAFMGLFCRGGGSNLLRQG